MPNLQESGFPTLQQIMDSARSKVNDLYPGIANTKGRILTNDAPFTIPYVNEAFETLQRKLRIEGVTFPIVDNYILRGVTALPDGADPAIQPYIGFNGYFDGAVMHATPKLPPNLLLPKSLFERTSGSNLDFNPMFEPEGGLPSVQQGPRLGVWEWRQYRIYLIGSTQDNELRLRYQSGQAYLNPPAADFATTSVGILDCTTAMSWLIAELYGDARGADTTKAGTKAQEAIDDMALEWVRRGQSITYRREAYQGGGSNNQNAGEGLGQNGVG